MNKHRIRGWHVALVIWGGDILLWAAIVAGLLMIFGCTSSPLEQARAWAWDAHSYELRPGDWAATPDGDCKNKALAIGAKLAAQGYEVRYFTGCRNDKPTCRLHMVPAVAVNGEWLVIDMDGIFPSERYPWTPIAYDIEAAMRREES